MIFIDVYFYFYNVYIRHGAIANFAIKVARATQERYHRVARGVLPLQVLRFLTPSSPSLNKLFSSAVSVPTGTETLMGVFSIRWLKKTGVHITVRNDFMRPVKQPTVAETTDRHCCAY